PGLLRYRGTLGEGQRLAAHPQGAQDKDSDVYDCVTMFSGAPAVCHREQSGHHRWRPDEGGEEERIVRAYAVLQWDKEGFDPGRPKPKVGEDFDSRWGPSRVVERVDDGITGTYLLLRNFPQGYHGK